MMPSNTLIRPFLFPAGFHVASGGGVGRQEYYVKEENPYTGEMTAKEIKVSTVGGEFWGVMLVIYLGKL